MSFGPIIMSVAGDSFPFPARILVILWEGATTSGDTVAVTSVTPPRQVLWAARTDLTQTYLGANFGTEGLHCPDGFRASQISAGRLLIYLREA